MKSADIIVPVALRIEQWARRGGIDRDEFICQIRRVIAMTPPASREARAVAQWIISASFSSNYRGDVLRLLDYVESYLWLKDLHVAEAKKYIQQEGLA